MASSVFLFLATSLVSLSYLVSGTKQQNNKYREKCTVSRAVVYFLQPNLRNKLSLLNAIFTLKTEKLKKGIEFHKWTSFISMLSPFKLPSLVFSIRLNLNIRNSTDVQILTSKAVTKNIENLLESKNTVKYITYHQNFCCARNLIPKDLLLDKFRKVVDLYHEMPLPEYSRYKNWTQSCYMEVHEKWTPKTETNKNLYKLMEEVLRLGKEEFKRWYSFKNDLKEVDVITMNSFITKYLPFEGKDEFGKHVDGIRIDGSLILALPEELDVAIDAVYSCPEAAERHEWEGLLIWDNPKEKTLQQKISKSNSQLFLNALKQSRGDEFLVSLKPGDGCFLEKMVWHHGLPITKGARYVIVCFYQCVWKKMNL